MVIYCFAIAGVIFNGPLQTFTAQGAGMLLFGAGIFTLVVGLWSGYRGALAGPQDISAAVLGTMATTVAAGTAHAGATAAFMTMTMLLIVSSLATGLVFVAVGQLRLSNLLRFIPYPVTAGFFAGTGWTISLAALALMSELTPDWESLPRFLDAESLWRWGPGAAYGIVLVLVMKRWNSITVLFGSFVTVIFLFHLVLLVLGLTVEDAEAARLVLSGFPESGLWPAFGPSDFTHVDWGVVAEHLPGVLGTALVTVLCLLVYINSLETASGTRMDLDREFRVVGVASLVAGAGGSAPGAHSIVLSLASRKLGADTPWTGILTALALGLTLFFGGTIVELIPTAVVGGLLLFLGVDLLYSWLIALRRKLHWTDYGTVVLIAATIAFIGFVEGIAVGLFAALALFAVRLSRMDLVDASLTGRELRSRKVRSVPDRTILSDQADQIRIFRLRGYLFFGSVHRLVEQLEEPLGESPPPSFIVLECSGLLGFDVSSTATVCAYLQTACSSGVRLVICAAPYDLRSVVKQELPPRSVHELRFEPDLDRALEHCEDASIAAHVSDPATSATRVGLLERVAPEVEAHLDRQILFAELVARLKPWLERRTYEMADVVAAPSTGAFAVQLLVAGRVSVVDADGERLFQCGVGDAIGQLPTFGVNATMNTAVAEEPCVTMLLGPQEQESLEATEPALAVKLYRFLMRDRTGAISEDSSPRLPPARTSSPTTAPSLPKHPGPPTTDNDL